jgi:hypothetical protein
MDERAQEQLAALGEVEQLLDAAQIESWLFGGWAVDFHAGAVTRGHGDVDLAVWLDDVPTIATLLDLAGWRHAPEADENGGTGYERGVVRLELTYLARDEDGVYTPLRDGRARWSAEALGGDVRELDGVRCRIVGLAALTRSKSNARDDPDDGAKDRADAEVLRGL